MTQDGAERLVKLLYKGILGREPKEKEFSDWVAAARSELSCLELISRFVESKEFRERTRVRPFFPPGHYYSPIVDPDSVRDYVRERHARPLSAISGISIDYGQMLSLLDKLAPYMRTTPFTEQRSPPRRFYYDNGSFPYGDAIALRAMIMHHRPRSIVEIGSGHTSACMLDSAEEAGLDDLSLTCIDPYAERLKAQLTPSDMKVVRIIEEPVQNVPLEIFSALAPGDFLFIDSTHVLKTGSDVHYELFEILPALHPGVFIHFHDLHFPFEYPDQWIFERNYCWNEIYALRAFLMYNTAFGVVYWNSLLAKQDRELLKAVNPLLLVNPGGSLWMLKKDTSKPLWRRMPW